jgi:cellulose biosynthesis protein BcsQ
VGVLAVYNFKGGVGKTATAVNVAYLASRAGERVLLWDLDPQGAASFTFRIQPKVAGGARALFGGGAGLSGAIRATDYPGLDLLPADFSNRHLDLALEPCARPEERLRELLAPLAGEYALVVLDCAPSLSLLSESVFGASDVLLAPTLPTPLSLRTLAKLLKHLKQRDGRAPRVLPFLCMVDLRKSLHRRLAEYVVAEELGFLASSIPYSSTVEQMASLRMPVCAFAPRDRAAQAYAALWQEVEQRTLARTAPAPEVGALKALVREVTGREVTGREVTGREVAGREGAGREEGANGAR